MDIHENPKKFITRLSEDNRALSAKMVDRIDRNPHFTFMQGPADTTARI